MLLVELVLLKFYLVPTVILLVDLRLLVDLVVLPSSTLLMDAKGGKLKGYQVNRAGLMHEEGRMQKPVYMVAQMPKVEGHRYVRMV